MSDIYDFMRNAQKIQQIVQPLKPAVGSSCYYFADKKEGAINEIKKH